MSQDCHKKLSQDWRQLRHANRHMSAILPLHGFSWLPSPSVPRYKSPTPTPTHTYTRATRRHAHAPALAQQTLSRLIDISSHWHKISIIYLPPTRVLALALARRGVAASATATGNYRHTPLGVSVAVASCQATLATDLATKMRLPLRVANNVAIDFCEQWQYLDGVKIYHFGL
ncbi:MAG: hypothetical protein ACI4QT_01500 [Kiritimatiellia bacterium]